MVVRVLARAEDVLVTHVVRLLIGHPVTTTDADGITAVEVPEGVHAVTAALPVASLEVAALVEDNLEKGERETCITHVKVWYVYIDWLVAIHMNELQGTLLSLEQAHCFFMSPSCLQASLVLFSVFDR